MVSGICSFGRAACGLRKEARGLQNGAPDGHATALNALWGADVREGAADCALSLPKSLSNARVARLVLLRRRLQIAERHMQIASSGMRIAE